MRLKAYETQQRKRLVNWWHRTQTTEKRWNQRQEKDVGQNKQNHQSVARQFQGPNKACNYSLWRKKIWGDEGERKSMEEIVTENVLISVKPRITFPRSSTNFTHTKKNK